VDNTPDGRVLALVADACLIIEDRDTSGLVRLHHLREDLLDASFTCGADAAAQAQLAVELIDAALGVQPRRTALAS